MTAALSVDALLASNGIAYHTVRSNRSARRPRRGGPAIKDERVVRTLLLVDDRGARALAVIPKSRSLDLPALNREFGRRFRLVRPEESAYPLPGLPLRALPPQSAGPRVEVFLEQSLAGLSEVFFETGDPLRLVRLEGEAFRGLFYGCWCGRISRGREHGHPRPAPAPG
jgi:Ala-tRNA(Pro) deacylase